MSYPLNKRPAKLLLLCLAASLFLSFVPSTSEARTIIKKEPLSIFIANNFECSEEADIIVIAPDESYFSGSMVDVQRLVGSARGILQFECPGLKKVNVYGMIDNEYNDYEGVATSENDWVLEDNIVIRSGPEAGSLYYGRPLYKTNYYWARCDILRDSTKAVNLYIQANSKSLFHSKMRILKKAVTDSRKVITAKFPNIEEIVIQGTVKGEWYYRGETKKADNWTITGRLVNDDDGYTEPSSYPTDHTSKFKLGMMYLHGGALSPNKYMAAKWIREAASGGDAEAQYTLGTFFDKGWGVEKSPIQAKSWLKKAEKQGYAEATAYLNKMKTESDLAEKQRIQEELKSRRKGIVYKNERFWQEFTDANLLANVFKGDFSNLPDNIDFKNMYIDFVANYSAYCAECLPAQTDSRVYISYTVKNNEYGIEEWRSEDGRRDVRIDPRFTPKYDQFQRDVEAHNKLMFAKAFSGMLNNLGRNGMVNATSEALQELKAFEMIRLFRKIDCKTATMAQLRENMLRAATSQRSIQAAGVVLPNAANESDPVGKKQKTFYQACLDFYEEKFPESPRVQYCKCLTDQARRTITSDYMAKFADDFKYYYDDIFLSEYSGSQDPRWKIIKAFRLCK